MASTLRIVVLTGPHQGRKLCLRGTRPCLVGRGPDCLLQLSGTERDQLISRHHCQLDFGPDGLEVQDLGSQNGTYLNGKRIKSEMLSFPADLGQAEPCECAHEYHGGELLTIGGTTLRIDVVDCPPLEPNAQAAAVWRPSETIKRDCPVSCVE